MRNLIPTYPREICFPSRRLIKTETEFYNKVNDCNKLKNVYFSLYCCTDKRNFENTHIDKIFFDFDIDKKSSVPVKVQKEKLVRQVRKFSDYLKEKDYQHLICFSGKKGFHVYVFTSNYENIVHKRDTIYNAYQYFISTLKITPDLHCKDLRRISRVPNTWHMEGRRYCIPIRRADLEKGFDHVKEKARKQTFDFVYYGTKLFDVSQFDYKSFNTANGDIPEYDYKIDEAKMDKVIKRFLPCVQSWLLRLHGTQSWKARYYFVIFCRDSGIPRSLCNKLARKYFGRVSRTDGYANNYMHFQFVKALEYGYERGDIFPNCNTLYDKKLCQGKCPKYNPNGSPLYF